MVKIRSKLKRNTKGKTWSKGTSSTSNPEQMKHRLKAKSRFFQPNLSLAPPESAPNNSTLTLEAVMKHEQRQAFNAETTTVNDVAGSLRSFSLNDDEDMSESQLGTFKTFKTFASNYSTCTNMSFKKLLVGFRASSDLHKEMLAILTALTEIIKERGGSESSTEYFLLLMEQIEASSEDNDIIAGVSLLAMGIKSVPPPVLRKRFGETADTLLKCLQRFLESNNQSVLKAIIGCLSVLLRAQDYNTWGYSSTTQYIDAILPFTIHQKPKIRKAAQHAIVSIIHGSCFMLPSKDSSDDDTTKAPVQEAKVKHHPAGSRVTKFCLNQFKPETLSNAQTTVLHTLTLLKEILGGFKTEDIRTVCEHLLSIMTASNVLVRTNCFQVFHALFVSRTKNLNGELCAKLLAAINEYRPDRSDIRQTLAWITVLKEGHIHLASLELALCINSLPRFIDVCANDLWLSDRAEIITGIANCLKELFHECVKMACENQETADMYVVPIGRTISLMNKVLSAPFGDVAKYVILTFSIIFEVTGAYFSDDLSPALVNLAKRYDTQSSLRIQIEHAIIAAIKSMGPEAVLKAIPLTNSKGEVILEKSWLLPLLREGASGASFKFFKETILPLALDCNTKWHDFAGKQQVSMSHTYELLCCQLWGLFPGFCRAPKDPENFKLLAPTIGNALDNNPEFRAPIFDGFLELLQNEETNEEIDKLLATYSKNFLPRLFNIYTTKPNGTYEADLRKKVLEVIKMYFAKTPKNVLKELFTAAKDQLYGSSLCSFEYDAIYDIVAALVVHQDFEHLQNLYKTLIVPILKNEKNKIVSKDDQKLKKQQRKAYELLTEIMISENPSCKKITSKLANDLENLLLEAFATSCSACQAARLRCLKILIESRTSVKANDKIIIKAIPEAVITFKDFSTKKENISEDLIKFIADLYQQEAKLNELVDILTAGFAGDESLISNTILTFRCLVQHQGKNLTIQTLEFIMEQILVFLVQKSRSKAEASVAFLISFIKVMPTPLVANHLESIMRSLSAMAKDTKRYCRIQIGYLLKKLCKRFSAEELIKFVPGDDEVTHRRLKKLKKQLRRETRKKLNEEKDKNSDGDDSEDDFVSGLEKKSVTIDDILADSDSDLPEDHDDEEGSNAKGKPKSKKDRSTYIREDLEDIVDLADIKSIGNVLTNRPNLPSAGGASAKAKTKDPNRGFKTTEDGRLIITDKALRGVGGGDSDGDSDDSDDSEDSGHGGDKKKPTKRGMEEDSSDEESMPAPSRKRKAADALSMRSGKTSTSRYTTGGKGIHRPLGGDAMSMKSGYSAKTNRSQKSMKSATGGSEYTTKKAKGDMKKKGKLDPYAYVPLSRNTLNKRKKAKNSGTFKNIVAGAKKGALKGVKNRIGKNYRKK